MISGTVLTCLPHATMGSARGDRPERRTRMEAARSRAVHPDGEAARRAARAALPRRCPGHHHREGSTDFTVQEVVDRSKQSLRSFYLQFDGKHELLLALFEDALGRSADQIRAAAAGEDDPMDQLRVAVELLFESSRPDPVAQRPLFTDFAPQLLLTHPTEVKVAHASMLALFTELMEKVAASGQLRSDFNARRAAAMTMQTVMFIAQSSGDPDATARPITADEVWTFCSHGFASK